MSASGATPFLRPNVERKPAVSVSSAEPSKPYLTSISCLRSSGDKTPPPVQTLCDARRHDWRRHLPACCSPHPHIGVNSRACLRAHVSRPILLYVKHTRTEKGLRRADRCICGASWWALEETRAGARQMLAIGMKDSDWDNLIRNRQSVGLNNKSQSNVPRDMARNVARVAAAAPVDLPCRSVLYIASLQVSFRYTGTSWLMPHEGAEIRSPNCRTMWMTQNKRRIANALCEWKSNAIRRQPFFCGGR